MEESNSFKLGKHMTEWVNVTKFSGTVEEMLNDLPEVAFVENGTGYYFELSKLEDNKWEASYRNRDESIYEIAVAEGDGLLETLRELLNKLKQLANQ